MSRRTLNLILMIMAVAVIGFIVYVYLAAPGKPPESVVGKVRTFLPFGAPTTTITTTLPVPVSGAVEAPAEELEKPIISVPKLLQISDLPVSGMMPLVKQRLKAGSTEIESAPAIRFADRATGQIYETFLDQIEVKPATSTIIPRINDALFGDGGNSVIFRYLENNIIQTYVGKISESIFGLPGKINGNFLDANIPEITTSPDGAKYFYLANYSIGVVGYTSNFDGSKKAQVFSSAFKEWISQWVTPRLITLTTKASAFAPGFMYGLDPQTKTYEKILGNVPGLTTLMSPNGKLVLYSESRDDAFSLNLYNINNKTSVNLGLKTMPEKCVWSADNSSIFCAVPRQIAGGAYPDDWYQGLTSFSDQIWKINAINNLDSLLVDPVIALNEEIDGIKPILDEKSGYFFFINKKDGNLWSYNLND